MDLIGALLSRELIMPSVESRVQELIAGKASVTVVPAGASVDGTGLLKFQNGSGTQLFSVQLPLYAGGVE